MRQLRLLMTFAITGVMMLMMSGTSAADVIINTSTTKPVLGPDERAVSLVNGESGGTVFGTITGPDATVAFSTSNDILFNGAVNGTPAVRAEDGSINTLEITLPGYSFTDAVFDVYGVYVGHQTLTLTVNLNDGSVTQTIELTTGKTSRNWFTVETINSETINSIDVTGAKFYALENTNISGTTSAVPEPATLALVMSGLLGAGATIRKTNRKSNVEGL